MEISWDRSVDAAYIHLIPPGDRIRGVVADSVALESTDEEAVDALDHLVLDFDRDGRLIGIEVLAARATLRESTLRGAR